MFIESAYPSGINFLGVDSDEWSVLLGDAPQSVDADVVDAGLAAHLGSTTITINFPDAHWAVVQAAETGTTVHVQGDVTADYSPVSDSPLLLSFQPTGTDSNLVFTSFHNHQQPDEEIQQILYYLVFLL
jgi:hypothetical protein